MASLRMASSADARAVAGIYGRVVESSAISFEVTPPTDEEMAARIAAALAFAPWLVCEREAEVVGYAYASRHKDRAAYQWSVDVAIYVRHDCHRRGIGRALYTSLFACLGLQGFYTAHAGVTLPNPGSVGLHESLGFRAIGVYPSVGYKSGAWRDVGWWQLPLRERAGQPEPPRSLAAAQADPGWHAALHKGHPLLRF